MPSRAVYAVLASTVVACGGSSAPPPTKPEPAPIRRTRIPIEEPDDEPQDGVEIVNKRGRMELSVIEAGIAPHKDRLSECYTARLGRRRWLGGRVSLHWDVDKSGEVTKVLLSESDLGAWPVERCLLEIARSASFGKPIGGDADFSIPLDFSAKGHHNTWDEDAALRAVGGQLASLDDCVDPEAMPAAKRGKPKKPKKGSTAKVALPEDVTITVYVGPQGRAQSVGFSSTKSVIDDDWASCAERMAMAWRLPDPRGTIAKLAVRYRAN